MSPAAESFMGRCCNILESAGVVLPLTYETTLELYREGGFIKHDNDFSYPVIEYPTKIVSLNFDKTPNIEGIVKGIKGQYLILDIGVLNIRKFSSYELEMAVN